LPWLFNLGTGSWSSAILNGKTSYSRGSLHRMGLEQSPPLNWH
jgi:hypothetical protein